MSLYYQLKDNSIVISGSTFPYKDRIKQMGPARFDGINKAWVLPYEDSVLESVKEMCKRVGGGEKKEPSSKTSETKTEEVSLSPKLSAVEKPNMNGMKIAELMERLDQTIKNNFYSPIWIIAEIQSINFREKAIYIDLADFDEKRNKSHTLTVRAMIWMSNYQSLVRKHGKKALEEVLVENIQGRFLAQVSFYKGNATISLQLLDLDTNFTKGLLALEREKLLKELKQKGLDVKNKSLKMTSFPLRIGLITAEGSRAMSDFLDQLHSYKYPGEVVMYPAHMQGESTLKDVASGLRKLSQMNLDAIVLTRGGGSAADLRWFDSPEIAYALAEAKMPVISAIGHHDDVCVAELISYHREKTPTAAADFFITKIAQTNTLLSSYSTRLSKLLTAHEAHALKIINKLQGELFKLSYDSISYKSKLVSHKKELLYRSHSQSLEQYSYSLDNAKYRLLDSYQRKSAQWDMSLSQMNYRLMEASRPVLFKEQEKLQRSKNQLQLLTQGILSSKLTELQGFESKLTSLNPTPWIEQGWTQLSFNGVKINDAESLNVGSLVDLRLKDAAIQLKIEKIIRK